MELENQEIVAEAPVEEATIEETVTEPVTEEIAAEIEETTEGAVTEEIVEDTPTEEAAEVEEVPVIFDANDEELTKKVDEVLEKYELPKDVQASIDALKLKAESQPSPIEAFSIYGGEEEIKSLLERQSLIDSAREEGEGQYRPNTDKFIASIADPETRNWLYYDLGSQPSEKYQGATKYEETVIDLFAQNGESPVEALNRYQRLVEHLQSGTFPDSDRPEFIPDNLSEAFYKLSKDTRNELGLLDPTDEFDRAKIQGKINELELIQRGIEGEKAQARQEAQAKVAKQQEFTNDVVTTQQKFFSAFRDEVGKDLVKNVQFSTDPKLNSFLATQQLALLSDALDPNGEYARQALESAGIQFDYTKATQLIKDVEKASVQLVAAKRNAEVDKLSYNKAMKEFERAGRGLQVFAKDIIDQEARLVSTGTAQAVKAEAEKIKIAPKARLAPKGAPTSAGKAKSVVPAYGTPEWNKYREQQVERMWEAAQRNAA